MLRDSGSRLPRGTALAAAASLLSVAPPIASAQMQVEGGIGAAVPTADLGNTNKPGPHVVGLVGARAHEQITINAQLSYSRFGGKTLFQGGQSAGKESTISFITYGVGVDVNSLDRFSDFMLHFQAFGGFTTVDVGPCDAPCTPAVNQGVSRIEGGSETDFSFWGGVSALYKLSRSVAIGGGVRYTVVFSSGPNLTSLPLVGLVRFTFGQ